MMLTHADMHCDFRRPALRRINIDAAAIAAEGVDALCAGLSEFSGREPVARPAGRRAQAARISRLRFGRRRDAGGRPRSTRRRAEGKLRNLEERLAERAARRHRSASATPAGRRTASRPRATPIRTRPTGVAVVHNGIIENFRELRDELEAERRQVRDRDRHRGGRASRHRRDEARA